VPSSQERGKLDNEVLRILRKLGLSAENLSSLQELQSKQQTALEVKRQKMGRVWGFVALACAVLEWWYSVVTPEPNFLYSSALLAAFFGFVFLAFLEFVEFGQKGKLISILVTLLIFGTADAISYFARRHRLAEKLAKLQSAERKDTYRLLSATMEYEAGDDPLRSVFGYINGGDNSIVVTDVCAHSNALIAENGVQFPNDHFCMFARGEKHTIRDGGDGQSDPFLSRLMKVRLACAALAMFVDYYLETQPSNIQEKQFRFVTRWSPHGLRWLREDVQSSRQFCFDKNFQAPYGNSF
jgi:hypothetical protein